MLIEFSVENYRSFRGRQTLSMVAVPRLRKKENAIKVSIDGEPNFPSLLKVVAIYGPNASGKSSLVRALDFLHYICRRKPIAERKPFPVSAFRFDYELRDKPSVFEVHFIVGKTRYSFDLALTADRIHREALTIYKKGQPHTLYSRKYSEKSEVYEFDESFEGGEELHEAWRRLTGPQTLYISQAVANSNEELQQLRIPYRWLSELIVECDGMGSCAAVTRRLISDMPEFGEEVAKLLSDVDVPISNIRSKPNKPGAEEELVLDDIVADENIISRELVAVRKKASVTTTFTHKTTLGTADFDYEEESDGTKNLMGFALPWFLFRHSENTDLSKVLIVDELDSSLHPKLVEALVERHLQSSLNHQLIFTTHDTHLMDAKLLRRDQIWMTERDDAGATQLRSVHDFEGREGEDIEKRYYDGRYRALPVVKKSV